MLQLSPETLHEATGCSVIMAETWADPLTRAMVAYHVDNVNRMAAFIPQIAHESGRFKWVREIWGPTDAQRRYEGRADLGNTRPGDGFKYRGRGLIQITGRANYMKAAARLGIDCVEHPEILEQPEYAAMSAADFWEHHGLNELADEGKFELITRRINGGMNGYAERVILWEQSKRAFS